MIEMLYFHLSSTKLRFMFYQSETIFQQKFIYIFIPFQSESGQTSLFDAYGND